MKKNSDTTIVAMPRTGEEEAFIGEAGQSVGRVCGSAGASRGDHSGIGRPAAMTITVFRTDR
jgi:hypothetical protein